MQVPQVTPKFLNANMRFKMTYKEITEFIKKMKNFTNNITPEEARRFLQKTGIYTKKGNLKKVYK